MQMKSHQNQNPKEEILLFESPPEKSREKRDSRIPFPPLQEGPIENYWETVKNIWEHYKIKIIIIIAVLVLVYLLLIKTGALGHVIRGIKITLEDLNENHAFLVFVILYLLVVVVVCTCIFSHAAVCMLVAGLMQNFWLSVFMLILSSMTGSVLIYFLSKPLCAEFILSKIENSDYYIVLKRESQVNPWTTAFGTRLLFIPAGIKDYILTMIDNPILPFFTSCFVVHLFYIAESCLIASQIAEYGGEHSKSWSEKTTLEKIFSLMIWVIILFTVFFIIFLGNYVTKKIKEKQMESKGIELQEKLQGQSN